MAANVLSGAPSGIYGDRKVNGSNNGLSRPDPNLDETLVAEDVGPRNRMDNPHS